MLRNAIETGFIRMLARRADSLAFPLVAAGIALATTLSMTVPFVPLPVGAVLMAPGRWESIAV